MFACLTIFITKFYMFSTACLPGPELVVVSRGFLPSCASEMPKLRSFDSYTRKRSLWAYDVRKLEIVTYLSHFAELMLQVDYNIILFI